LSSHTTFFGKKDTLTPLQHLEFGTLHQ